MMNSIRPASPLLLSVPIYNVLLVAYPKKFREHYGTQMVQVFRDSLREAFQRRGTSGAIDLWLHTVADLLVTALVERIAEGSQHMFSPKVVLWGGLAGAFGGVFYVMLAISPESGEAALVTCLLLGLGGLAGLFSAVAQQHGRLALAGFALGIIGTLLPLSGLRWLSSNIPTSTIQSNPVLAAPSVLILSLGLGSLGIGLTLLGIASWLANTLRRGRGLPLGVGILSIVNALMFWLVYYVPMSQGRNPWQTWPPQGYTLHVAVMILLGLGWMVLGVMLMVNAEPQVAPSPPASA
jgi:hypothetical protein